MMNQKSIVLVLEDELRIALRLKATIEQAGLVCYVAHTYETAKQLLEKHKLELTDAVLDIKLNNEPKDGIDFALEVRATCPDVRITFFSSFTKDGDIEKKLEDFKAQFLDKTGSPIETDLLDKTESPIKDLFAKKLYSVPITAISNDSNILHNKIVLLPAKTKNKRIISVEDIIFVATHSDGNSCNVIVKQSCDKCDKFDKFELIKISVELKQFIEQFEAQSFSNVSFWKIDRSIVINSNQAIHYTPHSLYFSDNEQVHKEEGVDAKNNPITITTNMHRVRINTFTHNLLERHYFKGKPKIATLPKENTV